jgi:DNA/RNA-binding domain of Phe-tRNA-synthetase-like protein
MEVETSMDAFKLGVCISTGTLEGIVIGRSRREVFHLLVEELKNEIRDKIQTLDRLKDDPAIRSLRSFYWKIGIDPTKTRPSSEALVRRMFRKGLPSINNLVDAGNLASARSFIPIGLYDIERMEGSPTLRLSREGESFNGIGGKEEVLNEGVPVLSDEAGVIHIYPHRDSLRTMIREDTRDVLMISCGVKGFRKKDLDSALGYVRFYFSELGV